MPRELSWIKAERAQLIDAVIRVGWPHMGGEFTNVQLQPRPQIGSGGLTAMRVYWAAIEGL
jgi:hypothetical protein